MAKKKKDKLGSAKRFGVRYGSTPKHRLAAIEKAQRGSTQCPFCLYDNVKRLAMGIFACTKCNAKFTGKAYTIAPIKALATKKTQEFTYTEEEGEE